MVMRRFARLRPQRATTFLAVASLSLAVAGTAFGAEDGQLSGANQSSSAPSQSAPDFLFGRPHGWVSLNGTWLFPRASGDLFEFVGDRLTVDRSDFHARAGGGALGVSLTPRFDVVTEIDVSRHAIGSEYRDYVKPDRSPIAQTTRLNQSTVAAGIRFLPTGRGREVSRYAFIPQRVTPYMGAGINVVYYTFEQQGQFVDFVDLKIFNDRFSSNGWAAGPYLQAGADLRVWRRLFVNANARYGWTHASLDPDFVGFHGIDLAGFRGSTGISVVF
jgi:hypothetical protein